jgi:hypothetical protein
LFIRFAELAGKDVESHRKFAAKYGPLGKDRDQEKIKDWQAATRLIAAIIRLAAELPRDRGIRTEDWRIVCPPLDLQSIEALKPDQKRVLLIRALGRWFSSAQYHGIVSLVGGVLEVRPSAAGVIGTVAYEVARLLAVKQGEVRCSGCRRIFKPSRARTRGSRLYCQRCRNNKIPVRDAARDYRNRKKIGYAMRPRRQR